MILYGFPNALTAEAEPVGSLVLRNELLRLELADFDGTTVAAYLTPELARALAEALQLAAGVLDPATIVGAGAMLTGYPPAEAATGAAVDPLAAVAAAGHDPADYCGACGLLVIGHAGTAGVVDSAGQAWCRDHRPPPRVPQGGHVGRWQPGRPFSAPVPPEALGGHESATEALS